MTSTEDRMNQEGILRHYSPHLASTLGRLSGPYTPCIPSRHLFQQFQEAFRRNSVKVICGQMISRLVLKSLLVAPSSNMLRRAPRRYSPPSVGRPLGSVTFELLLVSPEGSRLKFEPHGCQNSVVLVLVSLQEA